MTEIPIKKDSTTSKYVTIILGTALTIGGISVYLDNSNNNGPYPSSCDSNNPIIFNLGDLDCDTVNNMDDKHPGQDDLALLQDIDLDGVYNQFDLYPGLNDWIFDLDKDGIPDFKDPTDNRHIIPAPTIVVYANPEQPLSPPQQIPDYLKIDTDHDGIYDYLDSYPNRNFLDSTPDPFFSHTIDTDYDGKVNFYDNDYNDDEIE